MKNKFLFKLLIQLHLLFLFFFLLLFTAPLFAQPGSLDPSFGSGGKVMNPIGTGRAMAIQSDGKIVVAGYKTSVGNATLTDFALARYNSTGSLDITFNGTGIVITDFLGFRDEAQAIAIQSDGKIVVAGVSYNDNVNNRDFGVARYNTDGSLDTTFNGNGKVHTSFGTTYNIAYAIAIQGDGKIVVGGVTGYYNFALARYNLNGSLDVSFNGNGKVITPGAPRGVYALAIQTDGKIVAAGISNASNISFAVVRYNTDGRLDSSFNGDGIVTTAIGSSYDNAQAIAIQANGKILVAGSSKNGYTQFALVRYNNDGSLDTTFNGNGKVTTHIAISPFSDQAWGIAIQSDGKILAAGNSGNAINSTNDFALVRYNVNGSLDVDFGVGGKVTTDFGSNEEAYAIKLYANRIYLAGQTNGNFALAAYLVGVTILPLRIINFSVIKSGDNAMLNWSVENQSTNNKHFEIERSIDGFLFIPIGRLDVLNNGNATNTYKYTDANIAMIKSNGIIYYRLKQVDKDGLFAYSEIRQIQINSSVFSFGILNNPIKGTDANFTIHSQINSKGTLYIFDMQLKKMHQSVLNWAEGFTKHIIQLPGLSSGIYIANLVTRNERYQLKFIK